MAARTQRLIGGLAVLALAAAVSAGIAAVQSTGGGVPAQRIVSLVPALTEMLFAIGAGKQVIGVSTYDTYPPEAKTLPRVGALLDPDVERILALRPDLVIVYASQTAADTQFARAGIRTFSYRHGGIVTVLDTLTALGRVTGHDEESQDVARRLRSRLEALRARVSASRPRTLLVISRQPGTLRNLYASGGIGFLHEMLEAAGGENVFADVKRESVQPSQEMLLARAPDVIIEVRAEGPVTSRDTNAMLQAWASLASIPAVRRRQIHLLSGGYLVVPGPRIADGAEAFARVLHPEAFTP